MPEGLDPPNKNCVRSSGGSRGRARGARPPLFLDQNEARRAKKMVFLETAPPSLSKGLDDQASPYLSSYIDMLSGALFSTHFFCLPRVYFHHISVLFKSQK